jgi:phospholipase C
VSPWIADGEVFNEEYRHTSLIATLREQWGLGDPFTARDAAARTFSSVFRLDSPRDPKAWPEPKAQPVPPMQQNSAALGAVISVIGKNLIAGIREYATENNLDIEGLPKDPKADIPDDQVLAVLRQYIAARWFPLLASKELVETKQ